MKPRTTPLLFLFALAALSAGSACTNDRGADDDSIMNQQPGQAEPATSPTSSLNSDAGMGSIDRSQDTTGTTDTGSGSAGSAGTMGTSDDGTGRSNSTGTGFSSGASGQGASSSGSGSGSSGQ